MSEFFRDKVISLALRERGYLEKASNSELGSKTANPGFGNYNKYADYIDKNCPDFYNTPKNGFDWCDVFVDWLFIKSFGEENARRLLCQPKKSGGAGCYYSVLYYKARGRYFSTPKKGDQIFFMDSSGEPCHTGIVIEVNNGIVRTVEGNTTSAPGVVANGGCVAEKAYAVGSSFIHGYGRPLYDDCDDCCVTKRACRLYDKAYKDVASGAVPSVAVPKGTKLRLLWDDGWGWSKVEYLGESYFVMNFLLSAHGLSAFHKIRLTTNRRARLVSGGKLGKVPRKLPAGTEVKIICTILSGRFSGYKYVKAKGKAYYLKSAK